MYDQRKPKWAAFAAAMTKDDVDKLNNETRELSLANKKVVADIREDPNEFVDLDDMFGEFNDYDDQFEGVDFL